MRSSFLMSLVLHVTVVLLSVIGLPYLQRTPAKENIPMVVELVSIASETNLPAQPIREPVSKIKQANPPLPIPAKSETKVVLKQKRPEPISKILPEPKPTVKRDLNPKPVAKPKRILKPVASKKLAKITPRRKPTPPDPFALVLKNLEKEIKTTQVAIKPKKKNKNKKSDFEQQIAKVLTRRPINESSSSRITMTEMHAMINTIRTAIMPCWNLQPGAKGAQNIVVIIGASLNPDGRVTRAWVKNRSVLIEDPFKLAAAEAAQRAILNQACQPFKLDPKKYDIWKDVTLNFNPSEMFGR
ncbi:MAG TPA: hypothetical protein EYO32_11325 [Rhodospirillales bacterium]|nr:hypothetical protein [Rhodospirillales bacterium]